MKKVLSFVLAVVMVLSLSTVAFAWEAAKVDTIIAMVKDTPDYENDNFQIGTLAMADNNGEGGKYVIGISTGNGTAKDFNITAKVKKGDDVVKATVKASDKTVEIQAIPDYSWSLTKSEKFEVVVRVVPATKDFKSCGDQEITFKGSVVLSGTGNLTNNETGASAKDVSSTAALEDGVYLVPNAGETIKVSKNHKDLTLNFDFDADANGEADDEIYMEFSRIYDQGAVTVVYNNKSIKAVQKANLDAELAFYNFVSAPEFDVAGKLIIEADEDKFIYEVVDGKPVASKFAWDEDEFAWVLKTNVLGCYVVSDKELEVAADAPVANPSTGASDMVNVAVAMAVVSLAAAGAVALKK